MRISDWSSDVCSSDLANRVYVNVRFGGGYNALPADKQTPAWAADLALVSSGIGKLGQDDLDALTAGRRNGMDFGIDDDAFSLAAMTSPDDLAGQQIGKGWCGGEECA